MLGGGPVEGGKLVPAESYARREVELVQSVAEKIAADKKIQVWEVKTEDIQADPSIKELGLGEPDQKNVVETDLGMDPEFMTQGVPLVGFKKIDFNDSKNKILGYAVPPSPTAVDNNPASRKYRSFKDAYSGKELVVYELKITQTPPPQPTVKGQPAPPAPKPTVRDISFGPVEKSEADKQIEQAKKQGNGLKIEVVKTVPASFYSNDKDRVVAVVDGEIKSPHRMTSPQLIFFPVSPDVMNKLQESPPKDPGQRTPPQRFIPVAIFSKG